MSVSERCPCLSGLTYGDCCARAHSGAPAPTAEALMRSRFSAFALGLPEYLLESWHPRTRPVALELDPELRWYRLDILDTVRGGPLDAEGVVEFRARFHSPDGPGQLRERSAFVREAGAWLYVDGEIAPGD